tara:strand:+ start:842 stop:1225 length:384 start_codon:yes stop_codon:yes gene_type:complete
MPRGLNRVELIGNVGGAPEIRTLDKGDTVAEFSLATSRSWTKRDGGREERTEWHNCKAWGKLADIVGEYVVKGQQVYVEGRLETRSWDADDGSKRYRTEVVISELILLGRREEGTQASTEEQDELPF